MTAIEWTAQQVTSMAGLSEAQRVILVAMKGRHTLTVRQAADALCVTERAAHLRLKKMAAKGLVVGNPGSHWGTRRRTTFYSMAEGHR